MFSNLRFPNKIIALGLLNYEMEPTELDRIIRWESRQENINRWKAAETTRLKILDVIAAHYPQYGVLRHNPQNDIKRWLSQSDTNYNNYFRNGNTYCSKDLYSKAYIFNM